MKLKDFEVEQWMNDYEHQARVNLTDTSVSALTFKELMDLEPGLLDSTVLDYGEITGDPRLKAEILSFYINQDPQTLTMAQGCLQANEMVLLTLLEPGDHVMTLKPGYQQFSDYPRALGCSVEEIPLNPEDWSLDSSLLRAAVEKRTDTKLLILNNPSNPTGSYIPADQMEEIIALCREHGIWLLCDEVYKLPPQPAVSDLYEKGISTSSLSKFYGLAGLRLGWIKAADKELMNAINSRRDYSIISTGPLCDALGYAALKHKDELLARADTIICENKQTIAKWLKNSDVFDCVLPEYGTVSFLHYSLDVPSKVLAQKLLEETGIFFVPGACFGYENYLRLGLGQKHEDLEGALLQLEQWIEKKKFLIKDKN